MGDIWWSWFPRIRAALWSSLPPRKTEVSLTHGYGKETDSDTELASSLFSKAVAHGGVIPLGGMFHLALVTFFHPQMSKLARKTVPMGSKLRKKLTTTTLIVSLLQRGKRYVWPCAYIVLLYFVFLSLDAWKRRFTLSLVQRVSREWTSSRNWGYTVCLTYIVSGSYDWQFWESRDKQQMQMARAFSDETVGLSTTQSQVRGVSSSMAEFSGDTIRSHTTGSRVHYTVRVLFARSTLIV